MKQSPTKLSPKIKEALQDFADTLETEYGLIEGFEVRLEHPVC